MSHRSQIAAIVAAIALGGLGVAATQIGGDSPPRVANAAAGDVISAEVRTITVNGAGEAEGAPDQAQLMLGVQAQGRSAKEALGAVNEAANKMLKALADNGVAKADVTTSNISVFPNTAENQRITGYNASNSVRVLVHDVAKTGTLIDAVTAAAGNAATVQGVNFSFEDAGPLREQARAKAVAAAKTRAEQLAKAAGVSLGRIHSISEQNYELPTAATQYSMASDAKAAAAPIEPGTQTIAQQVTVVYEIDG
jgi:uncharacterized protein YggE